MKKVIFLAIAAAAALTACSKSEVIDSKYGNDMIGFETYLGRDAQTKAEILSTTNLPAAVGLYGFYTGADIWKDTTTPNLWPNEKLTNNSGVWSYTNTKYWTNADDYYTFFAYAPFAEDTDTRLVAGTGANPKVTYTVPNTIKKQIDLLYANHETHVNMHQPTGDDKSVTLKFNHALSRITVKASENVSEYNYNIKAVTLGGKFITKGNLTLSDNTWEAVTTATAETPETYSFFTGDQLVPTPAAAQEGVAAVEAHDFAGTDNYLMVIPVNFAEGATTEGEGEEAVTTYPNAATLSVTYTTTFVDGNHVSNPMTKTLPVGINFEQGKAYALNLVFEPNKDNEITFKVEVLDWVNADPQPGAQNPENGTPVE